MERRNLLPGLILVLLGAYFLVANVINISGLSILLALGVAFLGAYVWRRRYGLLVAGCILTSMGVYSLLEAINVLSFAEGGWFLVFLGAGFLAIYPLSLQWRRWWPLVPGFILVGSGLLTVYASLVSLSWEQWLALVQWWPIVLVVLGLWMVLRQYVPDGARKVVGAALTVVVVSSLSLLAVSAGVIAANSQGFQFASGFGPAFSDRIQREVSAPVEGQVVVTASVGSIVVHPSSGSTVRVVAIRHAYAANEEQAQRILDRMVVTVDRIGNDIQISTSTPEVSDSRSVVWFGSSPWVDYEIWAPSTMGVQSLTSTGDTTIEGIRGGIKARTNTGLVKMRDVAGPLTVETSTGDVTFDGAITHDSTLQTSTGSVRMTVSPKSAFDLDVRTSTGSIRADLPIQVETKDDRRLRGTVNEGGARLQVQTSTGDVRIGQQ